MSRQIMRIWCCDKSDATAKKNGKSTQAPALGLYEQTEALSNASDSRRGALSVLNQVVFYIVSEDELCELIAKSSIRYIEVSLPHPTTGKPPRGP